MTKWYQASTTLKSTEILLATKDPSSIGMKTTQSQIKRQFKDQFFYEEVKIKNLKKKRFV